VVASGVVSVMCSDDASPLSRMSRTELRWYGASNVWETWSGPPMAAMSRRACSTPATTTLPATVTRTRRHTGLDRSTRGERQPPPSARTPHATAAASTVAAATTSTDHGTPANPATTAAPPISADDTSGADPQATSPRRPPAYPTASPGTHSSSTARIPIQAVGSHSSTTPPAVVRTRSPSGWGPPSRSLRANSRSVPTVCGRPVDGMRPSEVVRANAAAGRARFGGPAERTGRSDRVCPMPTTPSRSLTVAQHRIGQDHRPFVVAEMSGNHNGDLGRALAIVDMIAESGAQSVKLQTYRADTITIDADGPAFRVSEGHELWGGKNLYQLYEEAHTPWEWHAPIFERAREHGLVPFSSPFDDTAVDLLEDLDAPLYKIASLEIGDIPLLRRVARTGKPVVLSTGAANISDVDLAVRTIRAEGNDQIVVLGCTSSYPASPAESNLRTIPVLRDTFDVVAGLSDHT